MWGQSIYGDLDLHLPMLLLLLLFTIWIFYLWFETRKYFVQSHTWPIKVGGLHGSFFLKKMGQHWPHVLFIFTLFDSNFTEKNYWLHRDLNSHHRGWRRALWPLDHYHGPTRGTCYKENWPLSNLVIRYVGQVLFLLKQMYLNVDEWS